MFLEKKIKFTSYFNQAYVPFLNYPKLIRYKLLVSLLLKPSEFPIRVKLYWVTLGDPYLAKRIFEVYLLASNHQAVCRYEQNLIKLYILEKVIFFLKSRLNFC